MDGTRSRRPSLSVLAALLCGGLGLVWLMIEVGATVLSSRRRRGWVGAALALFVPIHLGLIVAMGIAWRLNGLQQAPARGFIRRFICDLAAEALPLSLVGDSRSARGR